MGTPLLDGIRVVDLAGEPAALAGRGFHLHFGGTSWIASVFVNGQFAVDNGIFDTMIEPGKNDRPEGIGAGTAILQTFQIINTLMHLRLDTSEPVPVIMEMDIRMIREE